MSIYTLYSFSNFYFYSLVSLGVHIGHRYYNSTIYAAWMIYAYRQDICIINLTKFIRYFRVGFTFIDGSLFRYRPVWFVNKDESFDKYVRYAANRCGEFSSSIYWINGLLSNFHVVSLALKKIYGFPGPSRSTRYNYLVSIFKNRISTRLTWPGSVFVSSVLNSYIVVNEATNARFPCLGIVDTNTLSQDCSIVIPGNDDSLDCVFFYNFMVSEYILYRKYFYIFSWFIRIREPKRVLNFDNWIISQLCFSNFSKNSEISFKFLTFYRATYALPLKFFFGQNYFNKIRIVEQFNVFSKVLDYTEKVSNFFQSKVNYYYYLRYLFLQYLLVNNNNDDDFSFNSFFLSRSVLLQSKFSSFKFDKVFRLYLFRRRWDWSLYSYHSLFWFFFNSVREIGSYYGYSKYFGFLFWYFIFTFRYRFRSYYFRFFARNNLIFLKRNFFLFFIISSVNIKFFFKLNRGFPFISYNFVNKYSSIVKFYKFKSFILKNKNDVIFSLDIYLPCTFFISFIFINFKGSCFFLDSFRNFFFFFLVFLRIFFLSSS